MKVETEAKFTPVVITLETQAEVDAMYAALYGAPERELQEVTDWRYKMYDHFVDGARRLLDGRGPKVWKTWPRPR